MARVRRRHYRYRIGEMIGLNRAKQQVYVAPSHDEDGQTVIPPRVLGYDTLVIAVGSLSNDFGTPGVAEHAIALDTLDQAARFNRRMINACLRANAQYERCGRVNCIARSSAPARPAWNSPPNCTNRCATLPPIISTTSISTCRVKIRSDRGRSPYSAGASREHRRTGGVVLRGLGVTIRTGTRVMAVRQDAVVLDGGEAGYRRR